MKRGYRRLLYFQIAIFFILVLNSFVSSILSDYWMPLFLFLLIVLFKFLFGFEKDRHRYTKDIIFEITIFLLIFFILYYLFGVFIGFARTGNYYNLHGIFTFMIPLVLVILLKEFLRYMMLVKSEGSRLLVVTTVILFIFIDITEVIFYSKFDSNWNNFLFFALTLIPAISQNIACTYLTIHTGYKPVIFYLLIYELYPYLIPIIPNPNEYIVAIVELLVPMLLILRVYRFLSKDQEEEITQDYKKRHLFPLLLPLCFIILIVYFTSGYFHYHAIAIASGSMTPTIHKGDAVIIEKVDKDYDSIKEGVVLAHKYKGIMIVHRLIRIVKDKNQYYFYTKGDANKEEDGYPISEEMVVGIVRYKIPYIGIPTVWLNEL